MCRLCAEVMQTSIKVCVSRTFFYHMPSMHKMNHADFMHTFADIMQTLCRHYADYYTIVHLTHFYVIITGKFPNCELIFAGPTWLQRDGSVLIASLCFDWSRSRKTKGSLADTLQCNIWRRAHPGGLLVLVRGAPLPYPGEVGQEGRRWKVGSDGLLLCHDLVSLRLCSWQVHVC